MNPYSLLTTQKGQWLKDKLLGQANDLFGKVVNQRRWRLLSAKTIYPWI
jgi:hypothetical protein